MPRISNSAELQLNLLAAVVLKNAEMSFNFGDQPFKHPPMEGFVAFAKAGEKDIVKNRKQGSGGQVIYVIQTLLTTVKPSANNASHLYERRKRNNLSWKAIT